jgi:flagellar hook assembly protein FlgD
VKTLLNEQLSTGEHNVVWDGSDSNNKQVSSGIYLYKLIFNSTTAIVRKCLLLK